MKKTKEQKKGRGIITIQVNARGETIYVQVDGKRLTEPTHNLYDKVPPGVLKGMVDLGQIYSYDVPGHSLVRCVHRPNCDLY